MLTSLNGSPALSCVEARAAESVPPSAKRVNARVARPARRPGRERGASTGRSSRTVESLRCMASSLLAVVNPRRLRQPPCRPAALCSLCAPCRTNSPPAAPCTPSHREPPPTAPYAGREQRPRGSRARLARGPPAGALRFLRHRPVVAVHGLLRGGENSETFFRLRPGASWPGELYDGCRSRFAALGVAGGSVPGRAGRPARGGSPRRRAARRRERSSSPCGCRSSSRPAGRRRG